MHNEMSKLVDLEGYTDEDAEIIENDPIQLSVAGHTCVGKTEWLCSLLNEKVGITAPTPDATITDDPRYFMLPGRVKPYLKFYDVPGQQYSCDVLVRIKEDCGDYPSPEKIKRSIDRYLEDPNDKHGDDLQILKHLQACDIILYVVECRVEPTDDTFDEYWLVRRLGRPMILILNFSKTSCEFKAQRVAEWSKRFDLEGAKDVVKLDAFDMDPKSLEELGIKLVELLAAYPLKQKFFRRYWTENVSEPARRRVDRAAGLLAEYLVNAATYRIRKRLSTGEVEKEVRKSVQEALTAKQAEMIEKLGVDIKGHFTHEHPCEVELTAGRVDASTSGTGLFGGSRGGRLVRSSGRGAAVGAVVGGVITGLLSGGLGAPEGALIGAALGALADVKLSLKMRTTKYKNLGLVLNGQLDDSVLDQACTRGLTMIDVLRRRGYGNNEPIDLGQAEASRSDLADVGIMGELGPIRQRRRWSEWDPTQYRESAARKKVLDCVKNRLLHVLHGFTPSMPKPRRMRKLLQVTGRVWNGGKSAFTAKNASAGAS